MSRTTKDDVRHSRKRHAEHLYWRARWWLNHGSKRSSAAIRRLYNRIRRARERAAIASGRDPDPNVRDLSWVYW